MSSTPTSSPRNRLIVGDAATILETLPDDSVDCVVTSPPYFQLRDYRHPKQLGHEPDVHTWVANLVEVFEHLRRILKPTGTAWLNLADTYSRHQRQGTRRKSLLFGPERLLLALAAHGWIVRNKIVWAKTNPMPHSVRDRLSPTWEYMYLLTKAETGYWFDLDAIRIPHQTRRTGPTRAATWTGSYGGTHNGITRLKREGRVGHPLGKNPGDVWRLAKAAHRGQHSATYPEPLIEIPIRAGCPPTVCARCSRPTCSHSNAERLPGLVLDPFIGTGTTAHVAARMNRDWLGVDITDQHFTPPSQRGASETA